MIQFHRLKCKVVAGSANNQLKEDRHGELLEESGILYAPDYVINAGGAINVADELAGYNRDRAMKKVGTIYDNILRVFEIAERDGIPSYLAADRMAEERINTMRRIRCTFLQEESHIFRYEQVIGIMEAFRVHSCESALLQLNRFIQSL